MTTSLFQVTGQAVFQGNVFQQHVFSTTSGFEDEKDTTLWIDLIVWDDYGFIAKGYKKAGRRL